MPLAKRFGKDEVETSNQFDEFLTEIPVLNYDEVAYCNHKGADSPPDFWSYYLNHDDIKCGELVVSLLHHVLALPVGSADAERGFSIMKHAKYDRRSRLTPKHLEDILRLRINGPSLEKFDATRLVNMMNI